MDDQPDGGIPFLHEIEDLIEGDHRDIRRLAEEKLQGEEGAGPAAGRQVELGDDHAGEREAERERGLGEEGGAVLGRCRCRHGHHPAGYGASGA